MVYLNKTLESRLADLGIPRSTVYVCIDGDPPASGTVIDYKNNSFEVLTVDTDALTAHRNNGALWVNGSELAGRK